MAYQTFPQFQRLPVELQTQIWEAAIRPNRPGLQYLEIRVLNEPYEDAPDWHTVDIPGSNLFAKEDESLWTTEPQQDASWASDFQRIRRAKESAYFWDAGLWSACKTSRRIILTRVRLAQFARLILKFQPDRHRDLTVRVDPREDLFVVENFKFGNYVDSWDERIRIVPSFDIYTLQRERLRMEPAQIAFEYDSSWLVNLPDKITGEDPPFEYHPCQPFVHFAMDWIRRGRFGPLWLIDRSIKRKSGSQRPAARFHGFNASYHRILADEVSSGCSSAFTFLSKMNDEVELGFYWLEEEEDPMLFADVWVLECCEL